MITLAPPDPWYLLYEGLCLQIEYAIRKGKHKDAFKWLNVLDLIDPESAEYWRTLGWDVCTRN